MGALQLQLPKFKASIACPECGKAGLVFAYEDSRGHSSVNCVRCKKTSLVNYEQLKAIIIPPVKRFNKK